MRVRYPNVRVRMTEVTLTPSSILERVRRALDQGGVSDEEIDAYTREATSRCSTHLMYTTITWVETY